MRQLSRSEFLWQWTVSEKRPASEELQPGGIAVLKWLLSDPASPFYTDPDPDAISSLLRLAAAGMSPGDSRD